MSSKSTILMVIQITSLVLSLAGTFSIANGQKRIVGGNEVKSNEINYQASIWVFEEFICGGTIIGQKYILTAAHCLYGYNFEEPFDDIFVVTGAIKLNDTRNKQEVAEITLHNNYNHGSENSYLNDIAIITLREKINFDQTQAPALLPIAPVSKGLIGTIVGWGRDNYDKPHPTEVLKKAILQVLTFNECQPKMNLKVYDSQICGFARKDIGICKGDSGGPLMVNGTVVGISSWAIPCATGVPDVFTNVFYYLDFIFDVIGNGEK
ncbi:chymotrypsin-2-like [Episyrphus balteatus]|uniref:chymotrypsin-2-like n=1 Tax=Episyrphus balteatus TaxID=286459 RepID=UPI0024850429|nr:chymotrypsin-2-like [Episyrphus balteatus]